MPNDGFDKAGANPWAGHKPAPAPKSRQAQLTDPGLSLPPAATPAAGQKSAIAQATTRARVGAGAYGHGGVTGLLGEYTGPSLAKLITTGHPGSKVGLGLDVAGLLPIFRGPRAVLEGARAAHAAEEGAKTAAAVEGAAKSYKAGKGLLPRGPSEVKEHLDELAAQARLTHGNHVGSKDNPPLIEKGLHTPETGGPLGQQIREALASHAAAVRKEQKAGMSEEKSLRVKAAAQAGLEAGGGHAGHLAEKAHLQGEYGREFFGHLKHFTPEDVDQAKRVVDKAPLQFFEKTHVKDAIDAAVERGVVPTEGDQALMERVFGKVAGAETEAPQSTTSKLWNGFVSALNVPRALRSSLDVSAGFRQALVVAVTHPKLFARQWGKMIKEFGSEGAYQAQREDIHADSLYPLAIKAGVPFTDIGEKVAGTEEAFIGANAAEHLNLREIPGLKGLGAVGTGPGDIVRASDRAFTGLLNGTRMELFKMLVEKASAMGHALDEEQLKSIGRIVGTFTGRGTIPKGLDGHIATLSATLFSPRLMASRLNLMSPVYYYKLDPFARQEALKAASSVVSMVGVVMFAAALAGAKVTWNPQSSNFGKIKVGNTRIDITGGFNQYVRFAAQEMTREAISSAGHHSHIGWGKNDISDLSNVTKVARSKAAPVPGTLWDFGSGKDFLGRPVDLKHEAWQNVPFIVQDTRDAARQGGTKDAITAAFLSAIGIGVQSYKDKPPTDGGGSGGDNSSLWSDGGDSNPWSSGGGDSSLWGSP